MSQFEIYSLILCLIVFVMLVSLFSYMLAIIIKQEVKYIKSGLEDENLIKEFDTNNIKKQSKILKTFDIVFSGLFCLIFVVIFLLSLYVNCTENIYFDNTPTYRVVLTSSMESKNKKNRYLFENNLNNQLSAFDLIVTYKIPDEDELKLYDIVVYEVDGMLVVHRIVGIEEPNSSHPTQKYFLLQGDAVETPDRFPVYYSQMKGIYKGEKIPFVGSFVLFMQSPAGWLCILLVIVAMIGTPVLENKLLNARKNRYNLISQPTQNNDTQIIEENLDLNNEKTNLDSQDTSLLDTDNNDLDNTNDLDETNNVNNPNNIDTNDTNFTDIIDKNANNFIFANFEPQKSFEEKFEMISEQMKNRYNSVVQTLLKIENIRIIKSKTQHTYKYKSKCIAKVLFKGKTVNVCLGLNPKDYENTKYKFVDLSQKAKYKNYPMSLKLTSERQTRWVNELILELANKHGLNILQNPSSDVIENNFESNQKNKD